MKQTCPVCRCTELNPAAMRALQPALDLYARGRISLSDLQKHLNDAFRGNHDHDTALTITDQILKALAAGPTTAKALSQQLGFSIETVQRTMVRLRERKLVVSTCGRKPFMWSLTNGSRAKRA